jgi:hypothetical protein
MVLNNDKVRAGAKAALPNVPTDKKLALLDKAAADNGGGRTVVTTSGNSYVFDYKPAANVKLGSRLNAGTANNPTGA